MPASRPKPASREHRRVTGPPPLEPELFRKFFDFSRLPLTFEWKIAPSQRVYVNRNLRMDEISAIGFDMDYTLAIYGKREIEELAFKTALGKLVEQFGFPEEARSVRYDAEGVIRGLVVDRKHGNFLKMDQYNHVSRAAHGRRPLSHEERASLYLNKKIRLGQERYHSIDTLFGLPEGSLYQELGEFADANPTLLPPDYDRIFDDVRSAMDRAHRDNSIKSRILAEPGRYIVRDPLMAPTLDKFLKAGKKLFLLTNSEWRYTDAVMSFLLDGQIEYLPHWKDFFDLIAVEAAKPSFFLKDDPLEPVWETERGNAAEGPRIFRRGNVESLEQLLDAGANRILFIGDHTYGDILRSRKQSGWRTAMVIEELDGEIRAGADARPLLRELARRHRRVERHDFRRSLLQMKLALLEEILDEPGRARGLASEVARQRAELASLEDSIAWMHKKIVGLEEELERCYNPSWGPLFQAGNEISRFGRQVQNYACLYTARVSNFLAYPFNKYFQSPRDLMPHDL